MLAARGAPPLRAQRAVAVCLLQRGSMRMMLGQRHACLHRALSTDHMLLLPLVPFLHPFHPCTAGTGRGTDTKLTAPPRPLPPPSPPSPTLATPAPLFCCTTGIRRGTCTRSTRRMSPIPLPSSAPLFCCRTGIRRGTSTRSTWRTSPQWSCAPRTRASPRSSSTWESDSILRVLWHVGGVLAGVMLVGGAEAGGTYQSANWLLWGRWAGTTSRMDSCTTSAEHLLRSGCFVGVCCVLRQVKRCVWLAGPELFKRCTHK